jgi:hypothetical protein
MCFTPIISLTTAAIEFIVATFILIKYKRYVLPVFLAILIYVLGIYQFTEFMLCVSNNAFLWAKLGFITYTFLPAMGLHFVLRLARNRKYNWLVYLPPLFFSFWAAFKTNFIVNASCSKVFVIVNKVFTSQGYDLFFKGYLLYYSGFILMMVIITFILVKKAKDKITRQLAKLLGGAIVITITLPLILIFILPSLKIQFASVYCQFVLLFTIVALIGAKIYDKKKKKELF